jgi:hypothetical protein
VNEAPDVNGALASVGDLMPPVTITTRARAKGGSEKSHYKPLPKEFRRGGFEYRQICREDDFAIYQQIRKGNEHSAAFEVIRIRRRDGFQIGGRFVEPAEVYPNSQAWGVDGFTVTDKHTAFASRILQRHFQGVHSQPKRS